MAPSVVHLPNGQNLTITPVFGGLYFKSVELAHATHHSPFPPGWTIVLNSEDDEDDHLPPDPTSKLNDNADVRRHHHVHRFKKPSLRNDHMFVSSISNPSSTEFKPASSPTRQIAMMLWATLWWYFHQPEPSPYLTTAQSASTPEDGRPRGDWRVNINREGIFKGRNLLPKLERMGLIATEESAVNEEEHDNVGWDTCFVSRRSFWQLDPRIYLFTLSPMPNSPFLSSPNPSRPSSPSPGAGLATTRAAEEDGRGTPGLRSPAEAGASLWRSSPGPFASGSHLPTFYPPPPPQYTFTNSIRHPIRPNPPRQGETVYTRYIPSLGEYLNFRVASLSSRPVVHRGPTSSDNYNVNGPTPLGPAVRENLIRTGGLKTIQSDSAVPIAAQPGLHESSDLSDCQLLNKWMNDPRVAYSWGEDGPLDKQRHFLETCLTSKHSFPVIACFDGKPFAFFEIYWVKEDKLSALMGGNCGNYDRGLHVLVGEQAFRGPHRVRVWLSSLVHYCWLADLRTDTVCMEPRVDNEKLRKYLEEVGFWKEREVTFPHKQSNLMKIHRDGWEAPAG